MLCAIEAERPAMTRHEGGPQREEQTVTTRLAAREHDWLHEVYLRHDNRGPKFRMPDLLSACVALAIDAGTPDAKLLLDCLVDDIARRDRTGCRSCDIWPAQFELLMRAHRAPWNTFPHPKFELDQLATACVALVRARADAAAQVLAQARLNYFARMRPAGGIKGA